MNIDIGDCSVGDGEPCYIIAEIGSNHNQKYELAIESIDAAANAGVNAVKFQTFRAKDHYSKHAPGFTYLDNGNIYSLIESLELNRDWQAPLIDHAKKRGVEFLTSPCDIDAIRELKKMNLAAYKVASFDISDHGLLLSMAETGKPLIISTGMTTMSDIEMALNTVRKVNSVPSVLLQCTSLYPAPSSLSNLNAMATMRNAFGCLVGYSDHTVGEHITLASVALGACIVEKHFTLDRKLPGPDHSFSIEPNELAQLVRHVREVESSVGDGFKNGPRKEEEEMFLKARRSIHAAVDIEKGQLITAEMIAVKRPGFGIAPNRIEFVIGRKAKINIKADYWITLDMI